MRPRFGSCDRREQTGSLEPARSGRGGGHTHAERPQNENSEQDHEDLRGPSCCLESPHSDRISFARVNQLCGACASLLRGVVLLREGRATLAPPERCLASRQVQRNVGELAVVLVQPVVPLYL